jgi:tetratricopeptide (TPR) repeat protein
MTFVILAWFVAPGPYWLDSQEVGAAAVRLGSAHPTGFPLSAVLGALAALVPVGELAYRVHLVSAACAALTVGLVAGLGARLAGDDRRAHIAAGAAAVALAGSATFFRAATVTEVYAPMAALLTGALTLAERILSPGADAKRPGRVLALALIAGLALGGAHAELRLLLGVPLGIGLALALRRGRAFVRVAPALAALGAGGVLAYLPLRSASGRVPLLDWGHPRTASALWDHAVTAAPVRAAFGDEMLGAAGVVAHVRAVLRGVEADVGAGLLVCAGLGLVVLVATARTRVLAVIVAFVCVADIAFAVWINPMGIADRQTGVPLAVALALAAAVGVAAAAARFGRAAPHAAGVIGLIVATPALLSAGAAKRAMAVSDAPRRFAEAALAQAPPRAIVLVQSDALAAGTMWLREVEGARPDVAVLVRQQLADEERSAAQLAQIGVAELAAAPGAAPAGGEPGAGIMTRIVRSGRALLWEPGDDAPPSGFILSPGLPTAVLVPVPERGAPAPIDGRAGVIAAAASLAHIFPPGATADENAATMCGAALDSEGRLAVALGAPDLAATLFAAAAEIDRRSPAPLLNLGVLASRRGDFTAAASFAKRALAVRPDHPSALVAAARYHLALGDHATARRFAERAAQVAPRRADAWTLLGTALANARAYGPARRALERALRLDPSDGDARVNLEKLNLLERMEPRR